MRFLLHSDAQVRFGAMISIVNQPSRFSDSVELTNLVGDLRPQLRYRLQFGRLSIADHSDYRQLESYDWLQELFEPLFCAVSDVFGLQDATCEDITNQVNRLIAFIRLNPIDRKQ